MKKPDIEIGEQTFHPKEMNLWENVKTRALFGIARLLADEIYPDNTQYQTEVSKMYLGAFYGTDAVQSFEDFITPHPQSIQELQMIRQARRGGYAIPRLIIDPDLNQYSYGWNGDRVLLKAHLQVPKRLSLALAN